LEKFLGGYIGYHGSILKEIFMTKKVHLCPRCKTRMERVVYDDGSVAWLCYKTFSEPPYRCSFELWIVKNAKQETKGLD
jgi:hypothetical protein